VILLVFILLIQLDDLTLFDSAIIRSKNDVNQHAVIFPTFTTNFSPQRYVAYSEVWSFVATMRRLRLNERLGGELFARLTVVRRCPAFTPSTSTPDPHCLP
jgi:hypothetical protein